MTCFTHKFSVELKKKAREGAFYLPNGNDYGVWKATRFLQLTT